MFKEWTYYCIKIIRIIQRRALAVAKRWNVESFVRKSSFWKHLWILENSPILKFSVFLFFFFFEKLKSVRLISIRTGFFSHELNNKKKYRQLHINAVMIKELKWNEITFCVSVYHWFFPRPIEKTFEHWMWYYVVWFNGSHENTAGVKRRSISSWFSSLSPNINPYQ